MDLTKKRLAALTELENIAPNGCTTPAGSSMLHAYLCTKGEKLKWEPNDIDIWVQISDVNGNSNGSMRRFKNINSFRDFVVGLVLQMDTVIPYDIYFTNCSGYFSIVNIKTNIGILQLFIKSKSIVG